MTKIIEAPETIYLQWHGDGDEEDQNEVSTDDVTWSEYQLFDNDVKYHRASEWKSPEVITPDDGDYLTLIAERGRIYVEIAPWRHGEYQGTHAIGVNLGMTRVLAWMTIPPFGEFLENEI